jgi:Beta-galactosidase
MRTVIVSVVVAAALIGGLTAARPPAAGGPGAPSCFADDPSVAVPGAPHGMYAWIYNRKALEQIRPVIGKDPTLCGASIVVYWSEVEPEQGRFDFSAVEREAEAFTSKGLRVNLLFSEAAEGATNTVTPAWVLRQVPHVTCGGPDIPAYWDRTYEQLWSALMAQAIEHFSSGDVADKIGYLRFATGGGAEAIAPPKWNAPGCKGHWQHAGFSKDVWQEHGFRMLRAMAAANDVISPARRHQLIASLPYLPGTTVYEVPNAFAAVAAPLHIGLSFESLGMANVAAPGTTPARCNPRAKLAVLHFCQPFLRYAGSVPLAAQPITASTDSRYAKIDIANMLEYAIDNRIQILELYPEEWLNGDRPEYRAALRAASQVLGTAARSE